jgi:hypothetical protein
MFNIQIRSALQFHEFSSKMVNFQIRSEGCRAVPCRSPIRFFDPILNNALALRASHNILDHYGNGIKARTRGRHRRHHISKIAVR